MPQVKLTKTELRLQQVKLGQLVKYLPTLQLKKALLQAEVNTALHEKEKIAGQFKEGKEKIHRYSQLFSFQRMEDFFSAVEIAKVDKSYENIAGIDIPSFEGITFSPFTYSLLDTPVWFDVALEDVKTLLTLREKIRILEEKVTVLGKELREVSIRVNLFEKIMIPRAKENIKKIKIFLGDQQLAAIGQAKISKKKILVHAQTLEGDHR